MFELKLFAIAFTKMKDKRYVWARDILDAAKQALDYEAETIDTEHGYHIKSITATGISELELIKKDAA